MFQVPTRVNPETAQVAIFGAGPAGMSCANALLSFGITPVVIERTGQVGGIQRGNFHPNLWMLGMPGETGEQLSARLAGHYLELPLTTHLRCTLRRATRTDGGFRLRLATDADEFDLDAERLLLATGSRPHATPELEVLREASRRVIVGPLDPLIRDGIRADRVLILGGGDNALDHALFLAERGNRVRVCTRGRLSARRQFQAACQTQPEIELCEDCPVPALTADDEAVSAISKSCVDRYDWLLVMYGYRPNTDLLRVFAPDMRPALTASGHVEVDRNQRTSVAGIYAAGDLTENLQPSVPTAIAQGLTAARAIEHDRLADAAPA